MSKMGFNQKWLGWIQRYLQIVQYLIMINGEFVGPILPARGLRQCDPLSPYLLIL